MAAVVNRRQYLNTVGAITGAGLLAGCTQDGERVSGGTPTPERAAQAGTHLEAAGEALQKAGDELEAQSANFEDVSVEDGGVDFEPSTITQRLDQAATELDAAETHASERQQEIIDAAREYIAFARETTSFLDVTAAGFTQVAVGLSYYQSGRYTEAAAKLDTAQGTLAEADELLTIVQDRAEDLDTEPLEDFDEIDLASMKTGLTTLDELLPALEAMATGMRKMALGTVDFEAARVHIDAEAYRDAENDLTKAVDDFSAAEQTFRDLEEDVPASIQSTVIELTCYAEAMKDGCRHLAAAVAAQADGDSQRAQEESEKATEAFDRCNFETASD